MGKGKKVEKSKTAEASGRGGGKKEERRVRQEMAKARRKARGAALADSDVAKLTAELLPLGLRMERVRGDGNCLFRAMSDQLHGHEEKHGELRELCVEYLRAHAAEFGAFVDEEDVAEVAGRGATGFDAYLDALQRDGVWGGHVELHALARALRARVVVHQMDQPRWEVEGDAVALEEEVEEVEEEGGGRGGGVSARRLLRASLGGVQLHVAYLDGAHFDSVRLLTDVSRGCPPRRIRMTPTGAVDALTGLGRGRDESVAAAADAPAGSGARARLSAAERVCLDSTEGHTVEHVRAVLSLVGGDVSAAVDVLLAETAAREAGVEDWSALPDDGDDGGAAPAAAAGSGGARPEPTVARKELKKMERARKRAIELAASPNPHLALSKREQRELARKEAARRAPPPEPHGRGGDQDEREGEERVATSLTALKI